MLTKININKKIGITIFSLIAITIGTFTLVSLSFEIKNNNTQKINNEGRQNSSASIINNITNNIANSGTEKSKDTNTEYPKEVTLLVGQTYSDFSEKFSISLVEIIENKEATVKFNLDPAFSKVIVGDSTLFKINEKSYPLRITEVNGRGGYIKFKILSQ